MPSMTQMVSPLTSSSAKINFSYSILFNLTTSYSSYFGGKKGISRNKTSFFLLMLSCSPLSVFGKFAKVQHFDSRSVLSQCSCCLHLGHSIVACHHNLSLIVCPACGGPHTTDHHIF